MGDSGDSAKLRCMLRAAGNPAKARVLQSFFKTGPGQYAEGDVFLGVTVPEQRAIAKTFAHLDLSALDELLLSAIHEERLTALLILVQQYAKANESRRKELFAFYLDHVACINNWDLVDLTADKIVGPSVERASSQLDRMACSNHLWTRRVSIVATFHFIKQGCPDHTLRIARLLLRDEHDLIHKAVGWMLREVGKRCDERVLKDFLDQHAAEMPRTMLRYAIERLSESSRKTYMAAKPCRQIC